MSVGDWPPGVLQEPISDHVLKLALVQAVLVLALLHALRQITLMLIIFLDWLVEKLVFMHIVILLNQHFIRTLKHLIIISDCPLWELLLDHLVHIEISLYK